MADKNKDLKSTIKFPIEWNALKSYRFRIPIYQRRYAWGEAEVDRLIKDIHSSSNDDGYFIGNIVVVKGRDDVCEVIDGQQRLTTLYMLAVCLGEDPGDPGEDPGDPGEDRIFELDYEVRENDGKFLSKLKEKLKERLKEGDHKLSEQDVEGLIKDCGADPVFMKNLEVIPCGFEKKDSEKKDFEKIRCAMTVLTPDEVDVAKYFEVMNNRGRQLEKHQVLKAKFLEKIEDNKRASYGRLWDYCSDMDSYLEDFIMKYEKTDSEGKREISMEALRKQLCRFALNEEGCKIDDLFKKTDDNNDEGQNIEEMISKDDNKGKEEGDVQEVDHYRSILKFEYFLLHVLRLYLDKKGRDTKDFKMQDGKLLEQFNNHLIENKNIEGSQSEECEEFLKALFRYRILFDYFFIRRRAEDDAPFFAWLTEKDGEGLKIDRGKTDNLTDNWETARRIMNIQLLFNFTTDFHAQDWVFSALKWLKDGSGDKKSKEAKGDIDLNFYNSYVRFLEELDHKAMICRLKKDCQLKDLFYNENQNSFGKSGHNDKGKDIEEMLQDKLHNGTSTPHYWFYKLEYLLWRDFDWEKAGFPHKFDEEEKFKYSKIKQSYRLSRLNSIEHFKPQSLEDDWKGQNCGGCKAKRAIDCFGNLALISWGMNSTLLNHEDNKKLKIQEQLNRGTIESLKMLHYYSRIKSSAEMTPETCEKHQEEMVNCLLKSRKGFSAACKDEDRAQET